MSASLPDLLADNLSVVFCGLNPGLSAAAAGHHFVGKGNRFWRVIHLAGFTPIQIDPEHDASVLSFGIGLTTVVDRPTASATDVADTEFVAGNLELRRKIERYTPRNVAFLGKAAFSAITRTRDLSWGRQLARLPARQFGFCQIQAAETSVSALRPSSRGTANFAESSARRPRHAVQGSCHSLYGSAVLRALTLRRLRRVGWMQGSAGKMGD